MLPDLPSTGGNCQHLRIKDRSGGFRPGFPAGSFPVFAVAEGRSGADQGGEAGRVHHAPAISC
jgi:hypothetical protein